VKVVNPQEPAGHLPDGVSNDWWEAVKEQILEEEYGLVPSEDDPHRGPGDSFTAFNRVHGFAVRFSEGSVRIEPAPESEHSWMWEMKLAGVGREAARPVPFIGMGVQGNRIDYDRGGVKEWYRNSERGVLQVFEIPVRPEGESETLHLDLALSTALRPSISADGQVIDFYTNESTVAVLRYTQVKVTDAEGVELSARLEGVFGGIRTIVEDSAASYPITVTSLSTSAAWSATGGAVNESFGYSVSTAGDVNGDGYADVIIGARTYGGGTGKAYLYTGGPAGLSASASWTGTGEAVGDEFGASVSTAGDVNGDGYADVIIGANNYNSLMGKTYLFIGGPSGLSISPAWSVTGEATNDYFGKSAVTAGDVNGDGYSDVIVGAYGYGGVMSTGKAYLYTGGPSGLSTSSTWNSTGEGTGNFGYSVSTAGDVNGDGYADVIIGARTYGGTGKAYLYTGGPSGLSAAAAWSAVGEGMIHFFGVSVATAGDVNGDGYADVLVGAMGYSSNRGKAYLYTGGPAGLSASAVWSATGGAAGDDFGYSVSTAGDVNGDGYADVIVGAYAYSSGTGKAYLYTGGSSGLSASAVWSASGEATDNYFGLSVATAGDVNGDGYADVIVGAYAYSSGTGKAYLYTGGPSGLTTASAWSAEGEATSNYFGYSVSTAGDVNGDGYTDVLVGAREYGGSTGKAYLFMGGPSGLSATPSWSAVGEGMIHFFGVSVATAGDVNGDGYADVLVGAFGYNSNRGKAYLYTGGPAGLSASASWTGTGEAADDDFGTSVSTAGDVNGDGYSDVIVGASGYGGTGKAYLYTGGPSGLSTTSAWSATGETADDDFGTSVSTAGDVNGDGYSDVIVGASGYGGTGKAYLYTGGPSGLSASAAWSAVGEGTQHSFGGSVSTAGDVNGDSYADVLVGAYGYSDDTGKAYLYTGGPSGLSVSAAWSATGEAISDNFGISVATAGDINGDGYSDAMVGADGYNSNTGKAYLYTGGPTGLATSSTWTATGEGTDDYFGFSISTAGDVNGDDYSDVIVGASGYSSSTGKTLFYYGGGGPGVTLLPRQMRADLTAPIAPLGLAVDRQFYLQLLLRTPFGRGGAKTEWQAVPLGTSFNPVWNPIQSSPLWQDTRIDGSQGYGLVDTTPFVGPYKWRVRVRYHPVTSPFQSFSRWITMADNALQETDLRSVISVACVEPDEPVWLYQVDKVGEDTTINFQDPNQSNQRTGWNVRRSNTDSLPKSEWPVEASNVVDMDQAAPNYQWTDTSGDDPGTGGIWYYQVTAYNDYCPAEGPF